MADVEAACGAEAPGGGEGTGSDGFLGMSPGVAAEGQIQKCCILPIRRYTFVGANLVP